MKNKFNYVISFLVTFTVIIFLNEDSYATTENYTYATAEHPITTSTHIDNSANNVHGIEITAGSAVVIDRKTGLVLYEKDMNTKKYPASITKIMTALLVAEYAGDDLSERITFSRNAVFSLPFGTSNIAMNDDETLTIEEALHGLLLASANEVSNALAEHVSGSIEEFSLLMTQRARELGAYDTNFLNPHGLHDDGHYTTALDIALIMNEVVKHPKLVEIMSTRRYDIPPTEKQPESRIIFNTNRMVQSGQYYNEYVVGGKTGYTDPARHTLVTYARNGENELIVVILEDEKSKPYENTTMLLEYGFEQFEEVMVFNKNDFEKTIEVESEEQSTLRLEADRSIELNIPRNAKSEIKIEENISSEITSSVKKGDKLGELKILIGDVLLGSVDVLASEDVAILQNREIDISKAPEEQTSIMDNGILRVGGMVLIILLLTFVLTSRPKRRSRLNYGFSQASKKTYRYKN